eukprot:Skav226117  [mRNA]  locus=scaffold1047:50396:51292:- [translate_table: standard]
MLQLRSLNRRALSEVAWKQPVWNALKDDADAAIGDVFTDTNPCRRIYMQKYVAGRLLKKLKVLRRDLSLTSPFDSIVALRQASTRMEDGSLDVMFQEALNILAWHNQHPTESSETTEQSSSLEERLSQSGNPPELERHTSNPAQSLNHTQVPMHTQGSRTCGFLKLLGAMCLCGFGYGALATWIRPSALEIPKLDESCEGASLQVAAGVAGIEGIPAAGGLHVSEISQRINSQSNYDWLSRDTHPGIASSWQMARKEFECQYLKKVFPDLHTAERAAVGSKNETSKKRLLEWIATLEK